jgi:hypothetical protein
LRGSTTEGILEKIFCEDESDHDYQKVEDKYKIHQINKVIILFFKNSYLPQYTALFLLAALLWTPSLLNTTSEPPIPSNLISPLFPAFIKLFGNHHFLITLVNFTLVFSGAILSNHILEKNDLVPRNSLVAAFFFILLLSQVQFSPLNPGYIVAFLLLTMLFFILGIYKIPEPYNQVFNSGLLIALASFFYFPSIAFLLYIWIVFLVYRIYYWREWVILPIGVITLFVLFWSAYFMVDELNSVFKEYTRFFTFRLLSEGWPAFSILEVIVYTFISFVFLWSLKNILTRYSDKILIVRKRITSLFWFFLVLLISLFITGFDFTTQEVLFMLAISMLISAGISYTKKIFWLDIFVTALTVLILIEKYLTFVL